MAETERIREARATLRRYQDLLQSDAWAGLVEAANAQIHARRRKHELKPLVDSGKITEQQFEFGEAAGIELFIKIPQNEIDACRSVIEEYEQNVEENSGDAA